MSWILIAPSYDVLILGGGPAGLATAIHLRQLGLADVLVVEAGSGPRERVGETVPPDIVLPLNRLGLVERFRRSGHLPCPGSVSSWGREKPGYNDFILNPMGPAWHLDRCRFEEMLAERAVEAGADLKHRTRLLSSELNGDGFEVVLRNRGKGDHPTRARWVVDAAGSSSRFARDQGAARLVHDRMIALARFTKLREGCLPAQTMLEASRDGWWYSTRLPEDRVLTMFVVEGDSVEDLASDGYASWRNALRSTVLIGPRLEKCDLFDDKFMRVPILSSVLKPVVGNHWIAVGDAASSYDPISSQGIYKALIEAIEAARQVAFALGLIRRPKRSFTDSVRDRFEDYLANRDYLYGLEQRWPESRFWRRRAEAVVP